MKALILVDIQNDFISGSLAVPKAIEIIPVVNKIIDGFSGIIVATMDWHPKNHASFQTWPAHCIKNTSGAALAPELNKKPIQKIFRKGTKLEVDSYSAFFNENYHKETSLDDFLRKNRVRDVYIVGLALDYCVLNTALDANSLGYKTFVVTDACRTVNPKQKLHWDNVHLIQSKNLFDILTPK